MKKVLVFFPLLIVACSSQNNTKKVIWEGSGEPPQILAPSTSSQIKLNNAGDVVQVERQSVDGFVIEASYIKTVLSKKSKSTYMSAQYVEEIPEKLTSEVRAMKELSSQAWVDRAYKAKPMLQFQKLVEPPKFSIMQIGRRLVPVVHFNFLINSEEIQSWTFNSKMHLINVSSLGSHFMTAKAMAYPDGPKLTTLSPVVLKSLITGTDKLLVSDQINVTSESPEKINPTESLNFTPPDEKFDQVQVYYYLQRALNWFEDNLQIEKGQLHINAVAHLGYPEKTNAAFYYNGVIRLGAGDDVAFSHIPLDPSIVMHESAHALIDMLSSLPFQDEGGSLNEGFADFFTCVQLSNPKLGEVAYKKAPYKREIETLVHLNEKTGGLYHDSAIVSSFFWNLKDKIGAEKTIQLAIGIVKKLTPASDFAEFRNLLTQSINSELTENDQKEGLALLKTWEN